MHFVKREWRVRCNVSQIVLQQLACGRHLQLLQIYSYTTATATQCNTTTVACHVPSPSLDKHIWTSVSVRLSLILSQRVPPCELTLNWQWGWDEAPTDVVDRFLTQFSSCQCPAQACPPTLLWKSNNLFLVLAWKWTLWIELISGWPLGCFIKDTLKENKNPNPVRNWGARRKNISRRRGWSNWSGGLLKALEVWKHSWRWWHWCFWLWKVSRI